MIVSVNLEGRETMVSKSGAWTPLQIRELTVPNRVWLSPMCQYSADTSGVPTDWHLAHYASRAVGGAGMVMVECSGIAPDMRTTPRDLGLWNSDQVAGHKRLVTAIHAMGKVAAVQLGAAGRKSSHDAPWDNSGSRSPVPADRGGWQPLAPSPIAFAGLSVPTEMTEEDMARVIGNWAQAARNAHAAGYDALEIHGANGYLIHEFLSPLANQRSDKWGGVLEARMRFPLGAVAAVRAAWPEAKPLILRMPATDLVEGGLTTDEATVIATRMAAAGVDMIDVSAGVLTPDYPRSTEPLHNARFGPLLRSSGALVSASGLITDASHLDGAIPELVDAVFVGRAILRDPYWPLRIQGGEPRQTWPKQYHRAF
jgi:2,4-dienoyl-CoA reductase-like NADH-dependent reductase (Old Yellow Enzyme family)